MSEVEDLLQQLEEADDTDTTSNYDTSITYFLKKFNITQGEHRIGPQLLFKLYKATITPSLDYNAFRRELGLHLEFKNNMFLINKETTKISEDVYRMLSQKSFRKKNSKIPKGLKTFKRFVALVGLERGSSWIEGRVLYGLFQKYHKDSGKRQLLSASQFYKFADLYFKHTITDYVKYYSISEKIYQTFSKEEITEVRNAKKKSRKNERKRRRLKSKARGCSEEDGEEIKQTI